MQELNGRTSFFDDDDLNVKFDFRKIEKKDTKDLINSPTVKEPLSRQIGGQTSIFALHGRLMAYYKVPLYHLNLLCSLV
jgi:hypothetical protein